jgi:orotidine-5'-phosphate decarboxylase
VADTVNGMASTTSASPAPGERFSARLESIQTARNSLLCVGLDTDIAKIPAHLRSSGDPVTEFNRRIIDATQDLACAYKLNLAFYEAAGERGLRSLHATLAAIPSEVITIGDAKRGDIGNTAELYARALFQEFNFSACTVNPYMGTDAVEPFLRDPQRGVFILALTSNPGAKDFQYLRVRERPLYEHVIRKVKQWDTRKNCGLVIGATRPKELQSIRRLVPEMPLLIPGIGAQGGDLRQAIRHGCSKRGTMALINASRSVLYASAGDDFATAARNAARSLRDEINRYRELFF